MNKAQRDRLVNHMEKALEQIKVMPVTTPCAECLHHNDGACSVWEMVVPEHARPLGCGKWQEGVPF